MDSCRELSGAPSIRFISGMGLYAICGNPGDKVDVLDEIGIAGARVGAGAEGDLSSMRGGMLSRMWQNCMVAAVYPRRLAQPAFTTHLRAPAIRSDIAR